MIVIFLELNFSFSDDIISMEVFDMENDIPKRKTLRLKSYDYSSRGAYFITICTKDKLPILSTITIAKSVGDGAHDVPFVKLTKIGDIVERNLKTSKNIKGVKLDYYVIMPDHIHVIFFLEPKEFASFGTSRAPSPTNEMIPHVISTFKRFCNKEIGYNIFQRSYIEHVIRDEEDLYTRRQYIKDNPRRRYYKQ